ncbi:MULTISPECIES: Hachiman antiphage defense system protein HamA [unclassified Mesorhizobium]|uniref:Hachiman antiphage defense system protein HamA n=1 Tax=unclassified Mesorhizobium TaxID=325217 RepID=UPI001129418E|nr:MULTISPECIES: Hachiman antiphage defense system protein HamA [unclassified Mesorhizobium]TPI53612.1 DUF1837 domain-containing protein [Mesorhizobium sp. B3-1-1]TPJ69197.1 DUF1837 domain-containing protein [Mesorhizobium sp. B2-6-7]TPJ86713.1 DUF1837 domain-containing protein [Mesorhizobium sp. B2-6-3]TPK02496.1 DUF1837 domain-containing protein [Mesorhizobium sp. B2-5-10]TPK09771.1 DUF1837 domain-containing protein [Mesorhizobium sp. B2-5-11]
MTTPAHVGWLVKSPTAIKTANGNLIEIWTLNHSKDDTTLSDWARHFRQHYCKDADLSKYVSGTPWTNAQYLTSVKFPDERQATGPSTRSGDFGEILLADYVEYILNYWCPREGRYENRDNRNVPSNGCDVLAFKFVQDDAVNAGDELLLLESKAGLKTLRKNRLQQAVDDSIKDLMREAMSLNAVKQRLLRSDPVAAARVERFQHEMDRPFKRVNAAAAVLDDAVFSSLDLTLTDPSKHPNLANLKLLVIKGTSMMDLVHHLYERAANEA